MSDKIAYTLVYFGTVLVTSIVVGTILAGFFIISINAAIEIVMVAPVLMALGYYAGFGNGASHFAKLLVDYAEALEKFKNIEALTKKKVDTASDS